ncbi:hypothetical protein DXG01_013558, partial [Tephrocybe rancida]
RPVKLRKKPLPKSFNVPPPDIVALSKPSPAMAKCMSVPALGAHQQKEFNRYASLWKKNVEWFKLDVDLVQLTNRPKPCKADKKAAEEMMEKMKGWPSDPFSGVWTDRSGQAIVAVFAHRLVPSLSSVGAGGKSASKTAGPTVAYKTGPSGHPGRTMAALEHPSPGTALHRDGFS